MNHQRKKYKTACVRCQVTGFGEKRLRNLFRWSLGSLWFPLGSLLVPSGSIWFPLVPSWFPLGSLWFPAAMLHLVPSGSLASDYLSLCLKCNQHFKNQNASQKTILKNKAPL